MNKPNLIKKSGAVSFAFHDENMFKSQSLLKNSPNVFSENFALEEMVENLIDLDYEEKDFWKAEINEPESALFGAAPI